MKRYIRDLKKKVASFPCKSIDGLTPVERADALECMPSVLLALAHISARLSGSKVSPLNLIAERLIDRKVSS